MIDVLVKRKGLKDTWARAENEADALKAMKEQGYTVSTRWESVGPQRVLVITV